MNKNTITKIRELKIEDLDLKEKRRAIQLMDKIRKKHKLKTGEKNSTEIIRHFRDARYNR